MSWLVETNVLECDRHLPSVASPFPNAFRGLFTSMDACDKYKTSLLSGVPLG